MKARVSFAMLFVVSVAISISTVVGASAAPNSVAPSSFAPDAAPRAVAPGAAQPAAIHPAVARIIAPGKDSISYGSGTLVAVNDEHGLVVTNWHVVNEATGPVWVVFPDGFQSGGTIVRADRDWDLAGIAIWKPRVTPVSLAGNAPRPGEMLTIAGYGKGDYRAVRGQCTQYVAPGLKFPYEMVEVAASARQGDSGGPIFNERGELAGVLFGAGGGRTAGSYCGRVHWFVDSLASAESKKIPATMVAAQRPASLPAGTSSSPTQANTAASPAQPARFPVAVLPAPPMQPVAKYLTGRNKGVAAAAVAEESDEPPLAARVAPQYASAPSPSGAGQRSAPTAATLDPAGAIESDSRLDQIKTFLAVVCGLAIVLQTLRWLGSQPAQVADKTPQKA